MCNGNDLIDFDECMPVPRTNITVRMCRRKLWCLRRMDRIVYIPSPSGQLGYSGEFVESLCTLGIHTLAKPRLNNRPGDIRTIAGLARVVAKNQTRMQMSDSVNLFGWTYVSNVVKAHLLAVDKLFDPPLPIESLSASNRETISLTTGKYTIPSSGSGPP